MVISISPRIYEQALAGDKTICRVLRSIFSLVENHRHELVVEGDYSLQMLAESPEFSSYKELLMSVMERSEERHSFKVIIRITLQPFIEGLKGCKFFYGGKKGVVAAADSHRYEYIDINSVQSYLGERLHIFLENGRTDGEFLREMYLIVRGQELNDDLIDFRNCGGINDVSNHIEHLNRPIRGICIIDSDSPVPGVSNDEIPTIIQICLERDIHLHILEKRAIENYLPESVLRDLLAEKRCEPNHPYFEMTQLQKDCFNLKMGLTKKDVQDLRVKNLYSDLIDENKLMKLGDREVIIPGFEKRIAQKLYPNLHNKCSLPDLAPEVAREIQTIANLIEQNI